MLHWASLIIFFALSVLALWVSVIFLQKNGIYFFCIVASIVAGYFAKVELFSKVFSVQMVVIPVIFLALFITYIKYDKKETFRLFYIILFSQLAMFVLRFFEFAFLDLFDITSSAGNWSFINDSEITTKFLTWGYLNSFVGTIIAFALSCIAGYFFILYVDMKKVPQIIRTAIYIGLMSAINSLLFIILAYSGYFSFVDILLTFLLYIAFDIIICLLLGCYEFLTNGNQSAPATLAMPKREKANPKNKDSKKDKINKDKKQDKDNKKEEKTDNKKGDSSKQTTTNIKDSSKDTSNQGKTNIYSLVGTQQKLIKPITKTSPGTIKYQGTEWSVRSFLSEPIDSGEMVSILRVEGSKLVVKKATANKTTSASKPVSSQTSQSAKSNNASSKTSATKPNASNKK